MTAAGRLLWLVDWVGFAVAVIWLFVGVLLFFLAIIRIVREVVR